MKHKVLSIRSFIGSKNFAVSRNFYLDLGFEEVELGEKMSYFKIENFGFYLQDAYVKDWIDNTMIFMEVDDAERYYQALEKLNLAEKYEDARLVPIQSYDWGKECFLHDPSGNLWHFGAFRE